MYIGRQTSTEFIWYWSLNKEKGIAGQGEESHKTKGREEKDKKAKKNKLDKEEEQEEE